MIRSDRPPPSFVIGNSSSPSFNGRVAQNSNCQRVVLITGAAGGLGTALVMAFLDDGWRVTAGFHSHHSFRESEALLPIRLNVASQADAAAAVAETLARWGRLDVLVNNAGLTKDSPLAQMSEADWDEVMIVNLKGAFLCAQAALQPMLKQRHGHIVNIASFAGRAGARGQANYAPAKAGLIGLTTSLAREVGPHNIRVNAILPGVLETPMTAALSSAQLEAFARANALGRLNSCDEVSRFIVFLASTQNISGQAFQLDSRIAPWT